MKTKIESKVYYSDTDAYGVVWHGAYLRWLEMGRIEFCNHFGCNLLELSLNQDILIPVVKIDINYKVSAKVYDELLIETEIAEYSKLSITFHQCIKDKNTDRTFVTADVKVVCIHKDGALYKKMPEIIYGLCERGINAIE